MTLVIPPRIAKLPQDTRGYPIPWNVLIGRDGQPIFTANDNERHLYAINHGLCPICGESLEPIKWFIGGMQSAFDPHGWYYDLPCHQECAEFALRTCPYLAAPKYLHRIDIPNLAKAPAGTLFIDHTQIPERPEIFVSVACRRVEINPPYLRPKSPYVGIRYWREGKILNAEEGAAIVQKVMGFHPSIWRRES